MIFQSTPPARGATVSEKSKIQLQGISIHAPREGGDNQQHKRASQTKRFQSTPPARGATLHYPAIFKSYAISIHAPREGGDLIHSILATPQNDFNPRPPRGGRRKTVLHGIRINLISIHAPREGGDDSGIGPLDKRLISIHAPREGGDPAAAAELAAEAISIHAPREGGDCGWYPWRRSHRDFNPRPPRGGRRHKFSIGCSDGEFQSTPPARGATAFGKTIFLTREISIHAPREGGDPADQRGNSSPCISIHAPREGGDSAYYNSPWLPTYFNPRPLRGGRHSNPDNCRPSRSISIHAPREGGD